MENQRDIIHKNLVCRISNFNIAFFAMIMGFAGAMIVAMKFDFNFSIYFVSFALSLFILLLFSIAFLGINIFISKILFIIGAFFQLFFTLLILKK